MRTTLGLCSIVPFGGFVLAAWFVACRSTVYTQDHRATATDWSAKAREAPAQGKAGTAHPELTRRTFLLNDRDRIDRLPAEFPDISETKDLELRDIQVKSVPDALLKQISLHGKNITSLMIGLDGYDPDGKQVVPEISDAGMEYIARLPKLKRLCIACRCSAKGLRQLAELPSLEMLGLDQSTLSAKEIFTALPTLPKLHSFGIRHSDLSQPIDEATHKAIASLNGRLESLSFGEWQETTIHASMVPAIAEIESLTWLELGGVKGTLPQGTDHYLSKLPYLKNSGPVSAEYHPVRFRKVESAREMHALLTHLLGESDADKICRAVVRRRAGLSQQTEDFTKSKQLVPAILLNSFGATSRPDAWSMVNLAVSQCPELDVQIRRYLSGQEVVLKK